MFKRFKFSFLVLFVIWCLGFGISSLASASAYDGLWFMGFNVQKTPFEKLQVRQAVAHALNKDYVTVNIMSEEVTPASFIPPGMTGYDPSLSPYIMNIKYAKTLMKKAGYPPNHPALKRITLLHTDGIKTVEIAKKIQEDLKPLGIRVELVQVSYRNEDLWNRELSSRRHHLFLMGYKAEAEQLFTREASAKVADTFRLLDPLFKTGADANFTGFSNSAVDKLLDQVSVIGPSFQSEREQKFREINRLLYKNLPAVILFYIEKL
jgi:ABC-type transport system substrate-binding protein